MGSQDLLRVVLAFEAGSNGFLQHFLLLVLVFVAKEKLMGSSITRTGFSCPAASKPQVTSSIPFFIHLTNFFGVFSQICLQKKSNLLNWLVTQHEHQLCSQSLNRSSRSKSSKEL